MVGGFTKLEMPFAADLFKNRPDNTTIGKKIYKFIKMTWRRNRSIVLNFKNQSSI